jgi:diadenylate cyclase
MTVMDMFQTVFTTVLGYLRLVQLTDVIDMAAVAYVIYKGMTLLRKSSAAQVAKALAFIVVTMWISYQLNLNVVNFILGKAMQLGLLALVIVFQPEIRRFLEQIGSNDFVYFWGFKEHPVSEIENAIQETVAAYTVLSKDRVGALTVFERKNSLDSIIESGTVMDSTVSGELLKNIFYPKAPLHDGAVVIRKGRLAGAACMLPLSTNMNLSRDLGMRHRAGIGMSEHSDAIVAIVSEETGTISVASNGRLKRHLAPETLERVLRNELLPHEAGVPKAKKIRFQGIFKRRGGTV